MADEAQMVATLGDTLVLGRATASAGRPRRPQVSDRVHARTPHGERSPCPETGFGHVKDVRMPCAPDHARTHVERPVASPEAAGRSVLPE